MPAKKGNGVEVGVGYLSVVSDTSDLAKGIDQDLAAVNKKLSDSTTGKQGFGAKIAGAAKKGFKTAGLAAAGFGVTLGGIMAKKGLDRALNIEQAQSKLTGLGHSAETVATIMDNASASVKGTAFGLGDAASVAASAVAAGIKPGKDLERTLKAVADASTIAGTDMGSMGAIFNKVAASNKVQMDVINQLHDAGVPALALLADQLGVTAEEASKMASKGEIDFATFQAAMEKGMGGAALESGKTAQGAWANMMAALGRVGEKLVSKVLPYAKEFFGKVIEWADGAGPTVEKFAGVLTDKVLPAVMDMAKAALPAIKTLVSVLTGTVVPAAVAVFTAVRTGWPVLKYVLAAVLATVVAYKTYTAATKAWTAIQGVATKAKKLWTVAIGAETAATKAGAIAQKVFNAAMRANPIGIIITLVAALVAALVWFFTQTETGKKIWASFMSFLKGAWEKIKAFGEAIWGGITSFFTGTWDAIKSGAIAAWNAISGFFIGLWNSTKSVAVSIWNAVASFFTTTWNGIKSVATSVWNGIASFFTGIWNGIKTGITTAWNLIKTVISFNPLVLIVKNWSSITGWFGTLFGNVRSVITGAWDKVMGVITGIPGKIRSTFSSIADTVSAPFKKGFNAISGAWNKTVGKLSWTVPSWVPGMGGKTISAPKLPTLATGGTALASGWSLIGEQGPELLRLPKGASVVPLDHPASALAGDGTTIEIKIGQLTVRRDDDVRKIAQELARLIKRDKKALGGVAFA
jgi:tape measure domain-containing protein